MEKKLQNKIKQSELTQQKLDQERLDMLEVKRKLETERNAIAKAQEQATKVEQSEILNRGGNKRQPIRMSLNFGNKP